MPKNVGMRWVENSKQRQKEDKKKNVGVDFRVDNKERKKLKERSRKP